MFQINLQPTQQFLKSEEKQMKIHLFLTAVAAITLTCGNQSSQQSSEGFKKQLKRQRKQLKLP